MIANILKTKLIISMKARRQGGEDGKEGGRKGGGKEGGGRGEKIERREGGIEGRRGRARNVSTNYCIMLLYLTQQLFLR